MFNNRGVELLNECRTVLPFVYSHRAAAHQFPLKSLKDVWWRAAIYLLIYSDWSDLYQAPLRVSKSVSGPTIFRFCFISVPVFYQKVFEFLVKISQLWSHVTSRWLATVWLASTTGTCCGKGCRMADYGLECRVSQCTIQTFMQPPPSHWL